MIWLIGSKGLLGSEIARELSRKNIPWIGSNSEIDITDVSALNSFADSNDTSARQTGRSVSSGKVPGKINWVINCAGYTDVDGAENNEEAAFKVNATGALNVARTTRRIGAKLIHISTDYIFDGKTSEAYDEEAVPSPLSVYGKSKVAGEDNVTSEITRYYIIRTGWLYGHEGNSFVKKMISAMNLNSEVKVVDDQKGSLTSCSDLASVIVKMIETSEKATGLFGKKSALSYGIYNFTNSGECTWKEAADAVLKTGKKYGLIKNDCNVKACSSYEYGSPAERPAYSVLDCTKLIKDLNIKIPSWNESLERFMKELTTK